MFQVVVKSYENDEVFETFSADTLRGAERLERGVRLNLNHDAYYTEIISED